MGNKNENIYWCCIYSNIEKQPFEYQEICRDSHSHKKKNDNAVS